MDMHSAAPQDPSNEDDGKSPNVRLLLIDDEDRFRTSLAERLRKRGFDIQEAGDAESGIRMLRQRRPDIVLLDRKMPGLSGEEALRELKRIAPEVQVVMLTGHPSMASAAETGRLDAFAYLEKPCETDALIATLRAAAVARKHAMARHEIPDVPSQSTWSWLWGTHNFRPGIMILGAVLFIAMYAMPNPQKLTELLEQPKTEQRASDPIAGYAQYTSMKVGETIPEYYSRYAKRSVTEGTADKPIHRPLNSQETGRAARVMVAILFIAAIFWATGALPIGITAMLAGFLMYVFGVFPPDLVAKSYAKDAVIFILGILAMSVGIAKTGLDKRIGLVLLGTSRSLGLFLFLFLPLLAVSAAFFSEHALVAFIAPVLMLVYRAAIRAAGVTKDRSLAVLFILALCFAANQGGPGSPAAGGRNAIMVGILADYGQAPASVSGCSTECHSCPSWPWSSPPTSTSPSSAS